MSGGTSDGVPVWQQVEAAWVAWLRSAGHVVTYLGAAVGNHPRTDAPLISIGDRTVRAPDIQTTSATATEYWEVKYRSRPEVEATTGMREYWISYEAFQDYVELAEATGHRVWILVYEAPSALSKGRWLRADVLDLVEGGRPDTRFGRGADPVEAWVWPVSRMAVVDGPDLAVARSEVPVLVDEGRLPELGAEELAPLERRIRRTGRRLAPAEELTPAEPAPEAAIAADPFVGLDVLSRHLGLPSLPRYSVLRVGAPASDINEILGLLDYGIRVFLVTGPGSKRMVRDRDLEPYRDARMLEWAELEADPPGAVWVVDGTEPDWTDGMLTALEAADATGQLNLSQFRVVHAPPDGDVLVTAGAGTGKTETMVERLLFLLSTVGLVADEEGRTRDLQMNEVALVTFTREAAREIRERLARTLTLRVRMCPQHVQPLAWLMGLGSVQISTIHSFARQLLRVTGASLGFSPNLVLGSHTMPFREIVMKSLSPHLERLFVTHRRVMPPSHLWLDHITEVWAALSNNGVDVLGFGGQQHSLQDTVLLDEGLSSPSTEFAETTRAVIEEVSEAFREYCTNSDALPTNELLAAALAGIGGAGAVDLPYRQLFIDEFQDTDPQQMALLLGAARMLGAHLFVVGDAKQGIYRWRGAEGNAFSQLKRVALENGGPQFLEFTLTRNFRTSRVLLDSLHPYFESWGASGLLPYTPEERLRPGIRDQPLAGPVEVGEIPPGLISDWPALAAAQVTSWRRADPQAAIAILCRYNSHAKAVQQAIREGGGSCDLLVGGDFFRTPAVRELRALLEAVVNPYDDAALLELVETRWAGALCSGGQPLVADRLGWLSGPPRSPLGWNERLATMRAEGSFERQDLADLRSRVLALAALARALPTLEWLVECLATLNPESCSMPGADDERERVRYARCMDHLITLLDEQFASGAATIERVLAWLRLQILTRRDEDEPVEPDDLEGRTTALTVHKAKGLEFDFVLIPNTWVPFGPPDSATTRSALLRAPDGLPRLLWLWRVDGQTTTNTAPGHSALWGEDRRETEMEEARLLYVAMTRPRTRLRIFISSAPSRRGRSWRDLLSEAASS